MKETIIIYLQQCKEQIKLQHWNTYSYSTHKTTDKLYELLLDGIDEFVETLMGKYGRPDFPAAFTYELEKPENVDLQAYLTQFADYLIGLSDELDPRTDTDLLNIRDGLLGDINRAKYLLTLNK